MTEERRTAEGGCHCGNVRFRATWSGGRVVLCNCSICTKKGFLHLIIDESDFELLADEDAIETYTFGTHTAKHHFCKRCGIHSFYRPRSHPDRVDINVRCLEGVDFGAFEVTHFNGRDWEQAIETLEI
ncbi:MAG: GFA family protein [Polyangiales bacterium]